MNRYIAAQQALLVLKNARGMVNDDDIDLIVQTYELSEEETGSFITWIMQNDLAMPVVESEYESDDVYLKDIAQYPLLSSEEEIKLAQKARNGDLLARDMLIKSNLKLVVSLARRYGGSRLTVNDLVQEGNVGLLKAVDRYDPAKGVRFAHYASYWIRKYMTRAIYQNHLIHLPDGVVEEIRLVNRTIRKLQQQLERTPTELEISSACGLSLERIRELESYQYDAVSYDRPLTQEGNIDMLDTLADRRYETDELKASINSILDRLSERDRNIMSLRYGLEDNKAHTLTEIGAIYGISKERVRQIIDENIRKLKEGEDNDQ